MSLFSKKIIMPDESGNTGPVFVAGASGFFNWSEDLETFTATEQYLPGFEWVWYCMCNKHDGGLVAFSNYALAITSGDGKSWALQNEMNFTNPIGNPFACIQTQTGGYIIVGQGQNSLKNKGAVVQLDSNLQITGTSGIQPSPSGSGVVTGIRYSESLGQYIIVGRQGSAGFVGCSYDGLSYYFPTTNLKLLHGLAINGTKGVMTTVSAGGTLYLCNFSSQSFIPIVPDAKIVNWQGIDYYDGKYVACSGDGYVTVSTDGVTFSTPVKITDTSIMRVNCFDGLWVITGYNHILVSSDAYAWSEIAVPGNMIAAGAVGSFVG